jgi:tripartite-type tricarboxylate transporter receptor subunit TctC
MEQIVGSTLLSTLRLTIRRPGRRRSAILVALALQALLGPAALHAAQPFPDKAVRLVVPFAPGGLVDTFARTLQPRLSEALGQQAIIENRGGAGGTIAEALVARAAPDGYTVLFAGDAISSNPHLYSGLSYDLFRDLAPVSLLTRVPMTLVVPAGLPVTTAQEFVAYARARPNQLSYASPGSGVSYFAAEMFKGMAGIELTHVPYKGGGPAMIDLVSGQVHALITSVFVVAAQVKAGKIKALAVASERRSALLPQTPTFAEAGYPDFNVASWSGLFVPAGTPAPIVQRLHGDFAKALRSPDVEGRLQELGAEAVVSSPAEFAAMVKREYDTFGKLIRELKITVN